MAYRQSDTKKAGSIFYGWIVVVAFFFFMMIGNGLRYSFGVFLTPIEQDFDLTRTATAGIFSIYMIIASLAATPAGWFLDRYGPRIIGIIMGFFAGLGLFLTGQAYGFWHLYITYGFLFALGTGINFYIAMAVTSRWFVQKRGLALGIVGTGVGIGTTVIPWFASYLISIYGWRTSCLILAPIALLITIGSSLFLRKDPSEVNALPDGDIASVAISESGDTRNDTKMEEFSLTQALKTRSYWVIFLIWIIVSSCFHMVMAHVVAGAIGLGVPSVGAAIILSGIGIFSVPGRLLIGAAADRFEKKKILIVCALAMAGGLIILTTSSSLSMLYLFTLIFGFFYGGIGPAYTALIPESFGLSHIGIIMGTLAIAWGVGGAIGPALGGYVFDTTGDYYRAYLVGAVAMIIVAVFAFFFKPPRKEVPSTKRT